VIAPVNSFYTSLQQPSGIVSVAKILGDIKPAKGCVFSSSAVLWGLIVYMGTNKDRLIHYTHASTKVQVLV